MRRLMACLAAASVVALGSMAPASAKTQDSVELASATSFGGGAAVGLVYNVTCRPGYQAQLVFQVSQRHGKTTTEGVTDVFFGCTGHPQKVSALLLPHPGQRPFRHRAAVISANLGNCSAPGTCTTLETQTTARLRRGTPPAGDQGPDHLTVVSATTVAHGAAVQVVVDVTCRADGLLSNVSAVISQRVRNTTTQGSAIAELTCTVSRQRFTLRLAAQTGQPPFQSGTAVLEVSLVDCLQSGDCPRTNVWLTPRLTRQPVT